MSNKLSESISVRVTAEQKELFNDLAESRDETLKELVLNSTIYGNQAELEERISILTKELEESRDVSDKIEQLEEVITAKELHIKDLSSHLERSNEQLANLTRLIDQSQQLQLSSVNTNKELREQLEYLEDSTEEDFTEVTPEPSNSNTTDIKDSRGLFARIFNL